MNVPEVNVDLFGMESYTVSVCVSTLIYRQMFLAGILPIHRTAFIYILIAYSRQQSKFLQGAGLHKLYNYQLSMLKLFRCRCACLLNVDILNNCRRWWDEDASGLGSPFAVRVLSRLDELTKVNTEQKYNTLLYNMYKLRLFNQLDNSFTLAVQHV